MNNIKKYRRCIILAAGEFYDANIVIENSDYVIAVDGGYDYSKKLNINPNLVIGDFDSLGYIPTHENVLQYGSDKDDTDTFLAIKKAKELLIDEIHIYFGFGGRFDHTYANLQALHFLALNGIRAKMIDKNNVALVINNDSISLDGDGYFSIFSINQNANGVNIKGAKYELNNADLTNTFPLGVSNEFIKGKKVNISIKDGSLLVIYQNN